MRIFFILFLFSLTVTVHAQVTVSGIVYDISKINLVENVKVESTNGTYASTDSMGRYSIAVDESDSLSFYYNGKPTQKFAVADIKDRQQFNISLKVPVSSRYNTMQEVKVFSKTYKQDSIENRDTYADIYNYRKPGISSTISPGGVAGADVNELINFFRFRRNKQLRSFQQRLEQQEQDKYVDYRFSKTFVKRITRLEEPMVDTFLLWYRPSYEFTRMSSELRFNEYVLNASYQFRKLWLLKQRREVE